MRAVTSAPRPLPDVPVQAGQSRCEILRLGSQDRQPVLNVHQQAVTGLDAQPLASETRQGNLIATADLDVHRLSHEVVPFGPSKTTRYLYPTDADLASPYGYYLTLCVLYATIFEQSPVGLSYRLADVFPAPVEGKAWNLTAGWAIAEQDAAFLQRVAWDTVVAYKAQP